MGETLGELLEEMEPTGDAFVDGFRTLMIFGGVVLYKTVEARRRAELLAVLEARRQRLAAENT